MATSNLNFFYNTVSDIPNRHLERVPLYVVSSTADPLSEEYEKSKIYFTSSDTNSIFKTPTGDVSFLKKLERAWTTMDFGSKEQGPDQVFLNAMAKNKELRETFCDENNWNISEHLYDDTQKDISPESLKKYRIENFYHRAQGNPLHHFVAFRLYEYTFLGKTCDVYYGGILREGDSTCKSFFLRSGVFVAAGLPESRALPSAKNVQMAMEHYENLHGCLYDKKLNIRYPVPQPACCTEIFRGKNLVGIPRMILQPLHSPLYLICQHLNRPLSPRCRGASELILAAISSPHTHKRLDEQFNPMFEVAFGPSAHSVISATRVFAASQNLGKDATNWARLLWTMDKDALRDLMDLRFQGQVPPDWVEPFDGALAAVDEALANGVGLLFCSREVVNVSKVKVSDNPVSLTPKKPPKRPRTPRNSPMPGNDSRKKQKTEKAVKWKDPHTKAAEHLVLPPEWSDGPKGTIYYVNGETTRGFGISKKASIRLKVLQHICADGGLIGIIPSMDGQHLFFGDDLARLRNVSRNENPDLIDLVGYQDIYGTVFKFDQKEDTYDDDEDEEF